MKKPEIGKKAAGVLMAFCMMFGLFACGSKEEGSTGNNAYQEYVIGIMDANYLGQYEKYMELTGSSQEQAQSIYEANIQNFVLSIEESLSIKENMISPSLIERLTAAAKLIYGQAKYKAVDVIRNGDTYTVTLEIEPIDFFGTIDASFKEAVDDFNERAKAGDFDDSTDAEYEEAYGDAVTKALETHASAMKYGEKIRVDVTLDYDKENNLYVISDEHMEALDGRVVKMSR